MARSLCRSTKTATWSWAYWISCRLLAHIWTQTSPNPENLQTLHRERTKGAQDLHKPCAPFCIGSLASLRGMWCGAQCCQCGNVPKTTKYTKYTKIKSPISLWFFVCLVYFVVHKIEVASFATSSYEWIKINQMNRMRTQFVYYLANSRTGRTGIPQQRTSLRWKSSTSKYHA